MRKYTILLLLFYGSFSYSQVEGQRLIDSLLTELPKTKADTNRVNILNDLAFNYQYINPETGHLYGKKALALSQKLQWNDGIATSYKNIGVNHSVDSEFDKALENYRLALRSTSNKKIVSKILRSTGLIYTYQSDYIRALDYDMKALKMSETLKDEKGIAAVLSNIGIVYYDLRDYKKAIYYYQKAFNINRKMGNFVYLSNNLGNLGNASFELKDYPAAINFYKQAITINEQLGDVYNKAINLGSLAGVYFKIKEYEKVLPNVNASLVLATELNDERMIASNTGLIGDLQFVEAEKTRDNKLRTNLFRKAIMNYEKALNLQKKLGNWKEISYNYEQLSIVKTMMGSDKEAMQLYHSAMLYKDSVFNEDNKQTIKNIEDKRSIELRDKEIKVGKLTLQTKEKEKWLYIFGIGFLLIIAGMVLIQSRNRKKNNKKLQLLNTELDQANKVKARFFSILNHDLRSPVSSLINFLHLQKESPELLDAESKQRMENKTITSAENLLDSMEDILLWSKGQMENFKPQPSKITVDTIFNDLEKHFSSVENVSLFFENTESLILFTDENYVKTILRNLIGNALKALLKTENPTVTVKAFLANGLACISVTDNGPGGSQEQFRALYDEKEVVGIKTGLGLHLIRDLAIAIDCKITIDSHPQKGTIFTLLLP